MAPSFVLSTLFSVLFSLFLSVDAVTSSASAPAASNGPIVSSKSALGVCPTIDGYRYASANGTYLITCGVDYYGTNIHGTGQKVSFQTCIDKCAADPTCQSLSWVPTQSTCWIKPTIYAARKSSNSWGVKWVNGPDSTPAGNVAPAPAAPTIPAVAVQLGPSTNPAIDRTSLDLIVPDTTSSLYYGPNTDTGSGGTAPAVTLDVTFKYLSVALDDSSYISVACSGGKLIATFSDTNAFNKAQSTWPKTTFVLVTAASSCVGADGQNIFFLTTSVAFSGSTATASGSKAQLSDVLDDLTMGIGSSGANSKRNVAKRQTGVYSGGFTIPLAIAPPTASLTSSPWGNQYKFYDFKMASSASQYVAESNALSALSPSLLGVSNPPPGIDMYCVDCAIKGSFTGTANVQVKSGAFTRGTISLSGSMEADIAIGINAFTEYSLISNPYNAPIISMGLPAVFTIANIVTFTPTLDLNLTALFDHSTTGTPGQYIAGATYKWPSFAATLDVANATNSASNGGSTLTSRSTFNAYGDVTSYLNAGLQYGLNFNVNFFNGKLVKNIKMSNYAGVQADTTFSSTSPSCVGVAWDVKRSTYSDVYSNTTLGTELYNVGEYGTTPYASGCATVSIASSTSSSTSTSQTSTSSSQSSTATSLSSTSSSQSSTSSSQSSTSTALTSSSSSTSSFSTTQATNTSISSTSSSTASTATKSSTVVYMIGLKTTSSSSSSTFSPTATPSSTSSVFSNSSTSTTSSSVPAVTSLSANSSIICPDDDGAKYTDAQGYVYQIQCHTDHPGADLNNYMAPDFQSCVNQCFAQASHDCIAVAWVPYRTFANCNFKSDRVPLPAAQPDTAVNLVVHSAVMVSAPPCSSMSCPANTQQYCTTNGQLFKIACEVSYEADPLASYNIQTLPLCLDKCSSYPGGACNGVVFFASQYRTPGSLTFPSANCHMIAAGNNPMIGSSTGGGTSALSQSARNAGFGYYKRSIDEGVEMGAMKPREVLSIAGRKLARRS